MGAPEFAFGEIFQTQEIMSNFYTNFQISGNNIFIREVIGNKKNKRKVEYRPTLYLPSQKTTNYKTFTGESVEPIKLGTIKETREFLSENENVDGFDCYGMTMYHYACISDEYPEHEIVYDMKKITILNLDIETESEDGFSSNAAQETPDRINVITLKDFREDLYHVFTFKDGEIYNDLNYYKPSKNVKHYSYKNEEEMLTGFIKVWRNLDPDIISGWNVRTFDIPYIYNRLVMLFDEQTAKKLSPWNIVQKETIKIKGYDHECCHLYGISILDYYQLYIKNIAEPRENYKLGYIAQVELNDTKLDWQADHETMKDFYRTDFQRFVEYNIQDVNLPDRLEAKLKLIEQTISVAYLAKCNYIDVMAQTRMWDMLIYNWLKQENIVIPFKEHHTKNEKFIGAYVKVPVPGMYHYIVSFDVASLYPNIIRVLNIGPETKKRKVKITHDDFLNANDFWEQAYKDACRDNCTLASNGVMYHNGKQSFFSRMVETLFNNRKSYQAEIKKCKKELENCSDPDRKNELSNLISKFDVKQKATKIAMNSLYGAFGSEFFRHFDIENAEAVTMSGQFIIQYIQKGINNFLNDLFKTKGKDYVVYSDTDSVYVILDDLVKIVFKDTKPSPEKLTTFLDKVCQEKLEPLIDKLFDEITKKFINGMTPEKPILSMKRESIADRGIFSSKKHYALQVWNSEGDNFFECNVCHNKWSGPSSVAPPCNKCKELSTKRVPKMKIMGFDMVKSNLPKFTKDAMRKAVNIIMTGTQDELADFIEKTKKEFMKLPVEEMAFPRGVNDLEKWSINAGEDEDIYIKGTPLATKAVLLYNEQIKKLGLLSKYNLITSSNKIKFVHLKQPNPIADKAIAFNGKFPEEFKLQKYVDYEDMFTATMINPLKKVLDPIGWSAEKQFDMENFFN